MKNINSIISGITTTVLCLVMSFSVFGQDKVDLNLATKVGENFIKMNGRIALSGEAGSLQRVQTDKFPNLYIFNADGHGWIIVSGDKRMQPILGFSDEGTFDPNDMAPAAEMIIGGYDYVVDSIVRYNARATDESVRQTWIDLENGYYREVKGNRDEPQPQYPLAYGPLVRTSWRQGEGDYNQFCPWYDLPNYGTRKKTKTGCVATAMAQILYYFKTNITNKTIEAPFLSNLNDSRVYQIKDANDSVIISQRYTPNSSFNNYRKYSFDIGNWDYSKASTKELAAKMMLDCGLSVYTRYGLSTSYAYLTQALSSLKNHFDFTNAMKYNRNNYNSQDWNNILQKSIYNNMPILYSGKGVAGISSNGSLLIGGHAYIIDAY